MDVATSTSRILFAVVGVLVVGAGIGGIVKGEIGFVVAGIGLIVAGMAGLLFALVENGNAPTQPAPDVGNLFLGDE